MDPADLLLENSLTYVFYQSSSETRRAPCTSDWSVAHAIMASTFLLQADIPKPQLTPAMTFSRPTSLAYRTIRSATSSGCSMKLVVVSNTPGISTFPYGSLTDPGIEDLRVILTALVFGR